MRERACARAGARAYARAHMRLTAASRSLAGGAGEYFFEKEPFETCSELLSSRCEDPTSTSHLQVHSCAWTRSLVGEIWKLSYLRRKLLEKRKNFMVKNKNTDRQLSYLM